MDGIPTPASPRTQFDSALRSFIDSSSGATERGAALASVAKLDASIGDYLLKIFPENREISDQMFGDLGPMGAFSQRIRFAYLLGSFSRQVFDELQLISKIRNAFAQRAAANDFSFPFIQGCTNNLGIFKDPLFILKYANIAWSIAPAGTSEVENARNAAMLKAEFASKGVDIATPNWGFIAEVNILAACVQKRTLGASKLLSKPLF
jgi:DNA-binding MltR family transcriptional regulator